MTRSLLHETSSNIILYHALKQTTAEHVLTRCQFLTDADGAPPSAPTPPQNAEAFWLTVWTPSSQNSLPIIELILSCLTGPTGNQPIFLWTPRLDYAADWIEPRMSVLVQYLLACVKSERVFAVFGMSRLVRTFASEWSKRTSIAVVHIPLYAAYFTHCTPRSFISSDNEPPRGNHLRRSRLGDLASVARLCKEFSESTIHYPLTLEEAVREARDLISKGQVWLYEAAAEIATICVVGRSSPAVSAITKVYTTSKWRRHGFAEALVRYVTRILFACGKNAVVLYVGQDNSAQRVYDRVGYVGLCGKPRPEGVEDALELAFEGAVPGHW